jgi:hypothetical protein
MHESQETYLAAHVREILARDPRVSEPSLRVDVHGRRAHVTGTVPTEERRIAIDIVIGERFPELEPDNRTTVAEYGAEPRVERFP